MVSMSSTPGLPRKLYSEERGWGARDLGQEFRQDWAVLQVWVALPSGPGDRVVPDLSHCG